MTSHQQYNQQINENRPELKKLTSALHKEIIHLHKTLALDIKVHPIFIWPFKLFVAYFDLAHLRLNFQTGIIIGFLSIAWSAHLVHLGIPISRGIHLYYPMTKPSSQAFSAFYTADWVLYSTDIDKDNHIFRSTLAGGQAILTFLGGLKSNTISLYLTDIAHHHLGVGILFVWATHLYLSLYKGFAHRIRDVFFVNGNSGPMIRGLGKSLHLELSLGEGGSSVITSVVAEHIYSLTPYLYLSYDYITSVALYVHHSWIASFAMMGSFGHGGIFLIRDYTIVLSYSGIYNWLYK